VIICLERGANCLNMVQLMPLHPETLSSLASFKSRLVLPFWPTGLLKLSWKTGVVVVVPFYRYHLSAWFNRLRRNCERFSCVCVVNRDYTYTGVYFFYMIDCCDLRHGGHHIGLVSQHLIIVWRLVGKIITTVRAVSSRT